MRGDNTQPKKVMINDDDHLQVCVRLARIKAMADCLGRLDWDMGLSGECGLFKGTIGNLMEAINDDVDAAEALLTPTTDGSES